MLVLFHQQDEADTYDKYLPQIMELQNEVDSWNSTIWTQNLYYLWLLFHTDYFLFLSKSKEDFPTSNSERAIGSNN